MKSEIEIDIFLNILFYYFIKRKYSDSEFNNHNKRFYNNHKSNFKSIKNEFDNCYERKINLSKQYDNFLKLDLKNVDETKKYIYYYLYCKCNKFYDDNEINKYYEHMSNNNFINLFELDELITNKYILKDDLLIEYKNELNYKNIIKIQNKIIYFINNYYHAGHIFALFIDLMNIHRNEEFIIMTTKKYYEKNKHVIELFKLIRGCDKYIYLEENNIYESKFKIINSGDFISKMHVTKEYENVKICDFKKINVNNFEFIMSVPDKKTLKYSQHIDIIDEIIKKSISKHVNHVKYENIFLVKNNNSTPFNNTPSRGFNLNDINLEKYNYVMLNPEEMEITKLIYLLNNANNIITSWNTISYINKFFFNKKSKVLMLCHNGYKCEYKYENFLQFAKNIYFVNCEKLFYLQDLLTDSITNEFLDIIINFLDKN